MTQSEYKDHNQILAHRAQAITAAKSKDYASEHDVLSNFKSTGKYSGCTPLQTWSVYFLKHVDAICAIVRDPYRLHSEPNIDRFADAMNYLYLGYALLQETLKGTKVQHEGNNEADCDRSSSGPSSNNFGRGAGLANDPIGPVGNDRFSGALIPSWK